MDLHIRTNDWLGQVGNFTCGLDMMKKRIWTSFEKIHTSQRRELLSVVAKLHQSSKNLDTSWILLLICQQKSSTYCWITLHQRKITASNCHLLPFKHLLDHLGVDYEVFGHKGIRKHLRVTPGLLVERAESSTWNRFTQDDANITRKGYGPVMVNSFYND